MMARAFGLAVNFCVCIRRRQKSPVNITAIEPVGNYAVKLVFDDNHASGLYSWQYLYELGVNKDQKWQQYLQRLDAAGHVRKSR